jgi:hypothetical protein
VCEKIEIMRKNGIDRCQFNKKDEYSLFTANKSMESERYAANKNKN